MKLIYTEDQTLREMLQLLVRKLGLLEKEGAQCCGMSLIQSHIIYEINRLPHPSLNDVSNALDLDNSTVSRQVQGMVEKGLIKRQSSARDRRFIELTLTPQGEELYEQASFQMSEYMQEIFSFVPEDKREQVQESIYLLVNAMRNSSCCP